MSGRAPRSSILALSALTAALLLLAGCTPQAELVDQTLTQREDALNGRDVDLYLSTIRDDYNYQGKTKNDLEENIRQRFSFWSKIEFQTWDRQVLFQDDVAIVEQKFSFRLTPVAQGDPVILSDSERIVLKRSGMLSWAEWKIAEGI